jgi:hypothetical protein
MKKRRSTFRTMACAAVLVMACVVRMASANACVVAGAHYQLTADVVDWSMTVGPGQRCVRGFRFSDVLVDRVELVSSPRFGKAKIEGFGFSYTATQETHGEDSFTVVVAGRLNGKAGQSTIRIAIVVADAASRDTGLRSGVAAAAREEHQSAILGRGGRTAGAIGGWNALKIGAGGFVTGIDIAQDGTKVVRTDTYGAYVWEVGASAWKQILTTGSLPATDRSVDAAGGVYEIAIAPSATTRLYMAFNGYVYRSDDRGRSWIRTHFPQVPGIDANASTKVFGRYMAIDPANADVVYVSTPSSGLWTTSDGGSRWSKVRDVAPASSSGLTQGGGHLIAFDRSSDIVGGKTQGIYATSYGTGVYHSNDAGATWTLTPGTPKTHRHLIADQNGKVYLTDNSDKTDNVNKWNGRAWSQFPIGNRGHSIAVDPANASRIFIGIDSGDLIISSDEGSSWVGPTCGRAKRTSTDVPWLAWTNETYMSNGDMAFDPSELNLLYFAEGVGVWYCNPPDRVATVAWQSQNAGIEQLVGNMVLAPPGGKPVVLAWDRPIFHVSDPTVYPSAHGPDNVNAIIMAWSADWVATSPETIVAVMNFWGSDVSGVSHDGGRTWTRFASVPGEVPAKIGGSVAAASADNFIWIPSNNGNPWRTTNGGRNWTQISVPGVPSTGETGWGFAYYLDRHIVAADRVNVGTFYMYNYGPESARSAAGLYKSTDKGATWTRAFAGAIANFSNYNAELKSVPGQAGHLFFTSGRQGGTHPANTPFMRSSDGGSTWTPVGNFHEVHAFGFGAVFPDQSYPAIFVAGYRAGAWGIWRSIDNAATWTMIGDFPLGSFDSIKSIDGDKVVAGTVYIAFAGSGFAYRSD